jgi:hypothetical protein
MSASVITLAYLTGLYGGDKALLTNSCACAYKQALIKWCQRRNSMAKAEMTKPQLIQAVKVLIEKGKATEEKAEQYYVSAGQHLITLKAKHDEGDGKWADWQKLVKEKIGISAPRASELMQIADGRKTAEEVRTRSTESSRKSRKNSSLRSEENGEPRPVTGFNDGLSGGGVRDLAVVQPEEEDEALEDQLDKDNPDASVLAFASRVGTAWQMGVDCENVLLPLVAKEAKPNQSDWDDLIARTAKAVEQWTTLLNTMKSMEAPVATRRRKSILEAA